MIYIDISEIVTPITDNNYYEDDINLNTTIRVIFDGVYKHGLDLWFDELAIGRITFKRLKMKLPDLDLGAGQTLEIVMSFGSWSGTIPETGDLYCKIERT